MHDLNGSFCKKKLMTHVLFCVLFLEKYEVDRLCSSLWEYLSDQFLVHVYDNFLTHADGDRPAKNNHQKLGSAGLALHYANIVTQIDTLVSNSFKLHFFWY